MRLIKATLGGRGAVIDLWGIMLLGALFGSLVAPLWPFMLGALVLWLLAMPVLWLGSALPCCAHGGAIKPERPRCQLPPLEAPA